MAGDIVFFLGKNEFSEYAAKEGIQKITYDDSDIKIFINNNNGKIPRDLGFKFRIDKFIYKISAIREALNHYGDMNDLVWLDSDIEIYAKLDGYLQYIAPKNNECFSFYDREGIFPYSETGVIYFSKSQWHKNIDFFDFLYKHIISGNVFDDEEWHDAFLISKYAYILKVNTKNLCKENKLITSNPIFEHKLARACLIHKKGRRKNYSILLIYISDTARMFFGKIMYYIKVNKLSV